MRLKDEKSSAVIAAYTVGTPIQKIYANHRVGHEEMYKMLRKRSIPLRELHKGACAARQSNKMSCRILYLPVGDPSPQGIIDGMTKLGSVVEYRVRN